MCGRSKRGRESISSQEGSSKTKKVKVTEDGVTDLQENVSTAK